MTIRTISVQSGSNGNCIYVQAGRTRLLLDAGVSGKQAQDRLAAHGVDIGSVDGVILSHDHSDHIRGAGVFQRKFGLPIYATAATLEAARSSIPLGEMSDVRLFRAGDVLEFPDVRVHTIPTPHDATDGVAFVLHSGSRRLGILTDLGHVFVQLRETVATLDAVFLESNYDPRMLEEGPYPEFLKQRIRGPHGHISNVEAAELLLSCARPDLRWACLSHLSEHNNHPQVALATHRNVLQDRFPLYVASRHAATGVWEV